ncbi:uncharacterized protein N7483_004754 [Penicillium malachiteum]|uniref:uncharacterized protein n=1 Tax=Penicillium malachiteum TaxID=1324776 RepID=UPI0025469688|nr:uncharacterized protein N7483_004754 [Penicillium malachiteum]KAJ5730246.1 hypothetical protein N7483_004754 [Penicillium malachiteum]
MASEENNIGPIHKKAFVVSTGFFLGLALIAVIVRFVVRFPIQRQRFQIDDALLLLASALLLAALIIMYNKAVSTMYLLIAISSGHISLDLEMEEMRNPALLTDKALDFHKWAIASLMLSWLTISAVKFFFLLFFWRLVDRLRNWKIYWWFLFIFNIANATFGVSVFYVSCPHWGEAALTCPTGGWSSSIVRYSSGQIFMDIVADMLILVIPIGLIWNVSMELKQKLVVGGSLCLTSILVALSVARAVGLRFRDEDYDVWEMYWLTQSANFSVLLAAASAFRSFFVAHRQSKASQPESQDYVNKRSVGSDRKNTSFFSDSASEHSQADNLVALSPAHRHSNQTDVETVVSRDKETEWSALPTSNSPSTHAPESICDLSTAEGFFFVQKPHPVNLPSRA